MQALHTYWNGRFWKQKQWIKQLCRQQQWSGWHSGTQKQDPDQPQCKASRNSKAETERTNTGKPRFNWDALDRHVKLLNCKLEVTNILETRAYKKGDEEKVPIIKNLLVWEGLLLMETFTQEEKFRNEKPQDCFQCKTIDSSHTRIVW